ncbi:MAG: hypothetical protein K6E30_06980 [Lachnospiraceae bacterium]|nr:hypothetical protein [Lachnospiraceae bacterium]
MMETNDIRKNPYENLDMDEAVRDDLNPIEVLTIADGTVNCPVHNRELLRKSFRYNPSGTFRTPFGVSCLCCPDCHRIFLEESKADAYRKKLLERGIECILYGREISEAYLRSQMPVRDIPETGEEQPPQEEEVKAIPAKRSRPDYSIREGALEVWRNGEDEESVRLGENDFLVISKSGSCSLEGHSSKELFILPSVKTKDEGRKFYRMTSGYCSECRKYYVLKKDFALLKKQGRPEVTVISEEGDENNFITSGEVFQMEKEHLKTVTDEIRKEIEYIHSQPDYVGKYDIDPNGGGGLNFAKTRSIEKYGARLDELNEAEPRPYQYRVDLTAADQTETLFLGLKDLKLEDGRVFISFLSDLGRKLANYKTESVLKDGKEYKVKLSRQFDIDKSSLFSYTNLRIDEKQIFREDRSDPVLIQVMLNRRRKRDLVDIVATIQEKQNRIVDTDYKQNIVVQGCAGSGKTMVMYHRIAALQYKMGQNAIAGQTLILTPSINFNKHTRSLAESLAIDGVKQSTVEEYYRDRLTDYSSSLKLPAVLASENNVPEAFVNYVYSDRFRSDFDGAYQKVLQERNLLSGDYARLAKAMKQPERELDFSDAEVMKKLRFEVQSLYSVVEEKDQAAASARENMHENEKQFSALKEKLAEADQLFGLYVKKKLPAIYSKIVSFISETYRIHSELENQLADALFERELVQHPTIVFRGLSELGELNERIGELKKKVEAARRLQEEQDAIFSRILENLSGEDIYSWMKNTSVYVGGVREEVKQCSKSFNTLEGYREEGRKLQNDAEEKKKKLEELEKETYGDDVRGAIQYLLEKTNEYSVQRTFRMVFDEAAAAFKKEKKIGRIKQNWHRYDLYAALLFAMRFYARANGSSRFLCVDEGQDLALNEYRLIYDLNQRNVVFNIYGDTNQLLKPGRGISDWKELDTLFQSYEYRLNENYRNSNQVTRFCNERFGMDIREIGVDGSTVRKLARNELEKDLSALDIKDERVAILVPRCIRKESYLRMDKLGDKLRGLVGDKIGRGRIARIYVDEAKGIEFDRVYAAAGKMTPNEMYISFTRALSDLIIVSDE